MTGARLALLTAAVCLAPALLALAVATLHRPVRVLLAAYAFVMPFGSAVAVPVGLPRPFNSLSTVVGMLAIGVLALSLAVGGRGAARVLPSAVTWASFVGLCALSFLWSVRPQSTLKETVLLASLAGLYLLVALSPLDREDLRWVETAMVLGAAVTGLYALFLLTGDSLPRTQAAVARFGTSGPGEGSGGNTTAAMLVLPLVVAVGRACAPGQAGRGRVGWWAGAAAISLALIATGSRGGLLASGVACVTLVVVTGRRRALLAFAIPLAAAWLVTASAAPDSLRERFFARDSSGRTSIWEVGLGSCPERCVVGSGWGNFSDVYNENIRTSAIANGTRLNRDAHNAWLRTLVETGLVGLLLLVAGIALAARELLPLSASMRGPPLAGLAGLVVSSTFLSSMTFKYFWWTLTYAALVTLAAGHVGAENASATSRPALQLHRRNS